MQTLVSLRLQVLEGYEALSQAAANTASECLASNSESVLLLPTGSTLLGMYRHLVNLHERDSLSFSPRQYTPLSETKRLAGDGGRVGVLCSRYELEF